MQLPRDGQEYAHITFNDLPAGVTVEASIDRTTWTSTSTGDTAHERLLLLRGPDSPQTEGTLVVDDSILWIRIQDVPEHVVRAAGRIWLE